MDPFTIAQPRGSGAVKTQLLKLFVYILGEIIDELLEIDPPCQVEISNALAAIIELGAWKYALNKLDQIKAEDSPYSKLSWKDIEQMAACHQQPIEQIIETLFPSNIQTLEFSRARTLLYALDKALDQFKPALVHQALEKLEQCDLSFEMRMRFNIRLIHAFLLEKRWQKAGEVFYTYPIELLNKGTSPLHFLYGCWLQATEGREMAMIHFTGLIHGAYPRTWTLASHELLGDLLQHDWFDKAFLWEKKQLYRQLSLYYFCAGEEELAESFHQLFKHQLVNVE